MHTNERMDDRRAGPRTAWIAGAALVCVSAAPRPQDAPSAQAAAVTALEETRLTMGKWIETQQIISKERNDWQQGREVLQARVDLLRKESTTLREKIQEAQANVDKAQAKRAELDVEDQQLVATTERLAGAVTVMEDQVRKLARSLPEPVVTRLQPLLQRMPDEAARARVSVAERFQNVIGILNEVNKANSEITVHYEVRTLADGKPSEVRALYIGLAQAYYLSAGGESGIGRPSEDGWTWDDAKAIASDLSLALEIMQGKHSPAFVPLPVKIQ
jgi:hypothetical protein